MVSSTLLLLLLVPSLISAQQTPSPVLTTSLTTGVSLDPSRNPVTFTSAITLTITPAPSGTQSAGDNTTVSGNSTLTGNSTATATSNSTTTTTPTNLPTAPTDVGGGGSGPGGAPSPGANAPGGIYGPDDKHISKATVLIKEFGVVGFFVALGTLVLL